MQKLKTDNALPPLQRKEVRSFIGQSVNLLIIAAMIMVSYVVIDGTAGINWAQDGYEIALLVLAIYAIYTNSYAIGKTKGAATDAYVKAEDSCREAINELTAHKSVERLGEFCAEAVQSELKVMRTSLLSSVCIRYETWEKLYADKSMTELAAMKKNETIEKNGRETAVPLFDRNELSVLRRIKKLRPAKFTPKMLTAPISVKSSEFLPDYRKSERREKLRKLVITLTSSLVTVNFSVQLVQDFSFASVIECVVKTIPLVWAWVSGQYGGFRNYTERKTAYYEEKTKLCLRAVAWLDNVKENAQGRITG